MRSKLFTIIILCSAMLLFANKKGVKIHGYASQGFVKSYDHNIIEDSKYGTFKYNEFGINFRSRITDKLSAGIQFTSKGYGSYDDNDVEVDWAYGTYNAMNIFELDAGIIKVPVGMYNEIRDVDMLRNPITLPFSVYDERVRDITTRMYGVSIRRSESYDDYGTFRYKLSIGQPVIDLDGRSADTFRKFGFNIVDYRKKKLAYCAKMEWVTPLENYELGNFELGGTYFLGYAEMIGDGGKDQPGINPITGQPDMFKLYDSVLRFETELITVFAKYSYEDFSVYGEFINYSNGDAKNNINMGMTNPQDPSSIIPFGIEQDATIDRYGYYGGMTYRFTEWFELGGYYSDYVTDDFFGVKHTGEMKNYLEEFALTTRFDIGYNLTIKLEGKLLRGELADPEQRFDDDPETDYDKETKAIYGKITYSF